MDKGWYIEHIKELKNRVLYSLLFFALTFVVTSIYIDYVWNFLLAPLEPAYQKGMFEKVIIFTNPVAKFTSYIKLSFFVSLLLSMPFFIIQGYLFIAPGLYKKEKKAILPFLVMSPILFLIGLGILYYMILPLGIDFLINIDSGNMFNFKFKPQIKIDEYLSFVINFAFAFGMMFQFPIILLFLLKIGIMPVEFLTKSRKYWIVGIFVIAAVITPPDILSQILVAIPLLVLYEVTILIGKRFYKSNSQ